MLFTAVQGATMPVVSGLYACRERIALALGTSEAAAVDHFLACLRSPLPTELTQSARVQTKRYVGNDALLTRLPILTHAPLDAGPYITAGVGVARDPASGAINTGIYRLQVVGPRHFTVGADPEHDLGKLIKQARERGEHLPFAVVLGHHPAFTLASQADAPLSVDSYGIAGALLGAPLSVVRALTIDLPVPADAEIVIEGVIRPEALMKDGPFAEFSYHYGQGRAAVCEVTAITHRPDPYYVAIHNAHAEHRCLFIFPGSEARLLDRLRSNLSCPVKGVHIPICTAGMQAHIALVDASREQAEHALRIALDHENLLVKHAIAVDQDIDPAHLEEVMWAVATRYQADRDLLLLPHREALSVDPSAHRADGASHTTKMGLNACLGPTLRQFPRGDQPARLN